MKASIRSGAWVGLLGLGALIAACGSGKATSGTAGTGGGTGGGSAGTGGKAATSSANSSSSASSNSSASSSTSSGGTCPGFGDPCTTCTSANCGSTYCACSKDPACVTVVQCVQQCQPMDMNCQQGCLTQQNKAGISEAFLISDCAAKSCAGKCPGVMALSTCEKCLFTNCATAMNTCLSNAECSAILACVNLCPKPDPGQACATNCAFAHPNGISDAQGVQSCGTSKCPGMCP